MEYEMIRKMTSDARMISINTDIPQYKIAQLKSRIFMNLEKPNADICEWWTRLYRGDATQEDIEMLNEKFDLYDIN